MATTLPEDHSARLLSPFDVRGLPLRNRVVMAPLTRSRAGRERLPNDLMAEYYAQRASAGLIISEATVISEQGIGYENTPGIYNDAQQEGWRKVVAAVHVQGAPMFLQLWHCGRASHSSFHGGRQPVSASAIKLNGEYVHTPKGKKPYETPRALEIGEISATVQTVYSGRRRQARQPGHLQSEQCHRQWDRRPGKRLRRGGLGQRHHLQQLRQPGRHPAGGRGNHQCFQGV